MFAVWAARFILQPAVRGFAGQTLRISWPVSILQQLTDGPEIVVCLRGFPSTGSFHLRCMKLPGSDRHASGWACVDFHSCAAVYTYKHHYMWCRSSEKPLYRQHVSFSYIWFLFLCCEMHDARVCVCVRTACVIPLCCGLCTLLPFTFLFFLFCPHVLLKVSFLYISGVES